jgi:hypothetical protein
MSSQSLSVLVRKRRRCGRRWLGAWAPGVPHVSSALAETASTRGRRPISRIEDNAITRAVISSVNGLLPI